MMSVAAVEHRNEMRSCAQRRELARFLRAARERVTPSEVGVAVGARRRAPGLLREEVAQRASISCSWYSWLEQGRDIQASAEVLTSVATALRLSSEETDYLFTLAGVGGRTRAGNDDAMRRMLHQLHQAPAYLVDSQWNIVEWNAAATAFFGLGKVPQSERNALTLALLHHHAPVRFVDPVATARLYVAYFRTDTVDLIGNPALDAMVERLERDSALFRRLWSLHEVGSGAMSRVEYHAHSGVRRFDFVPSRIGNDGGLRMHAFLPCSPDPSWA
ncbi:transcriptional regulator [Rhodococcus sp. WS4]|nr:transcriptional regulator [Rhodococcus sp. WS4]